MTQIDPQLVKYLRSPKTIRAHCNSILELARNGESLYFELHATELVKTVAYTLEEINKNYPNGNIPYHSRFRHLEMEGKDRISILKNKLPSKDAHAWGKVLFEMIFVSVLLDAGAGGQWAYQLKQESKVYERSEGLALASLEMFKNGFFSSAKDEPYRVDHIGLSQLDADRLAKGFQVKKDNPLVGLSGRLTILRDLSTALINYPYGSGKVRRLGDVYEHLFQTAVQKGNKTLSCLDIFDTVLSHFGTIWPGGLRHQEFNLGDVGVHSLAKGDYGSDTLVPFHKLSQWLTYSLSEAFEIAGLIITDIGLLTGLPEYRNGGLLMDLGVLTLKNPADLIKHHKPQSELVVEWRALTVALLDLIADEVRNAMGFTLEELPLAKVLQGGTWSAGRRIAKSFRPGGEPPITLDSDGTVF